MVPEGASRGKCGKPDEFKKKPAIAICTLLVQSVLAPRKARQSVWPIWYGYEFQSWWLAKNQQHQWSKCPVSIG